MLIGVLKRQLRELILLRILKRLSLPLRVMASSLAMLPIPIKVFKGTIHSSLTTLSRNYNEDRVSIILNMTRPASKKNIPVWPKCSYFAIYDGHGGSACADYLKDCLHQIIISQDCFPANPAQALTNGCLAGEAQFL